jgi:hypothetical protein
MNDEYWNKVDPFQPEHKLKPQRKKLPQAIQGLFKKP